VHANKDIFIVANYHKHFFKSKNFAVSIFWKLQSSS